MAAPKRRTSRARRDRRRAHWIARTVKPNTNRCPHCEAPKASHRVCLKCGYYDSKVVVEVQKEAAE